jgi:hypothetical protein
MVSEHQHRGVLLQWGEFVFHSKVKYQVTFEIKEVDPDGTPSELLPVFKGGGMEW